MRHHFPQKYRQHNLVQYETSFDPATDTRKSPCFLCSWNRRKALFTVAKEQGCNKIALGHHMDDILETLLMNITYQGAFSTMPPRLVMKKFDMTIIRPMCMVHEADLIELAALHDYRKQVKNCPYESQSSRSVVSLNSTSPPSFSAISRFTISRSSIIIYNSVT